MISEQPEDQLTSNQGQLSAANHGIDVEVRQIKLLLQGLLVEGQLCALFVRLGGGHGVDGYLGMRIYVIAVLKESSCRDVDGYANLIPTVPGGPKLGLKDLELSLGGQCVMTTPRRE